MTAGVTVPSHLPAQVRAMRNGTAKGSGLRLYIPRELTQKLGVKPGETYRLTRLSDGRIRLAWANAELVPVAARPIEAEPEPRIRPELTQGEAEAVERALQLRAAQSASADERALLLDVAKRMRRRMRLAGMPTPDRTDDHLERVTP